MSKQPFCATKSLDWDPTQAPKLDFNECYYSVLEIDPMIDPNEMKKAYYKIVFQYHPDRKNTTDEKELCNKQMMVINGAFRILRNPETRRQYDSQRKLGLFGKWSGVKQSGDRPTPPKSTSSSSTSSYWEQGTPTSKSYNRERTSERRRTSESYASSESDEAIAAKKAAAKKAAAETFSPTAARFRKTLEEMGYSVEDVVGNAQDESSFDFRYANKSTKTTKDSSSVGKETSHVWSSSDSKTSSDDDDENFDTFGYRREYYDRGDGSLDALESLLGRLRILLANKNRKLSVQDATDWGEVRYLN